MQSQWISHIDKHIVDIDSPQVPNLLKDLPDDKEHINENEVKEVSPFIPIIQESKSQVFAHDLLVDNLNKRIQPNRTFLVIFDLVSVPTILEKDYLLSFIDMVTNLLSTHP